MSDPYQNISNITVKSASQLTGKSITTIKRLISKNIIWSEKVKGQNGLEIRIREVDIIKHFNLDQPIPNDLGHDIGQDKVESNNPYFKIIVEQLEKRSNENITLLEKIDRLHDLLENQQKLTLKLQNEMSQMTQNQNLMLINKSQSNENNVIAKPTRKKFLGIF